MESRIGICRQKIYSHGFACNNRTWNLLLSGSSSQIHAELIFLASVAGCRLQNQRSASGCSSTRIVALLVLGVAGMAMSRKFSGATAWRQSYSRNRSMRARTFNSISLRESCGVENVTVCASSWLVRAQILHSAALEHWHWLGQPPSRPRNISYHASHETSCGRQDFKKVAEGVKRRVCGQRNRQLRE